ncbi:MAG: hypothetical protein ACXVZZ_00830, partial [Terriglobales bacterium]
CLHRLAHRRQVHDGGNAGEILQKHAAGRERDFLYRGRFRVPPGQGADLLGLDGFSILGAQQVFQQDAKRVGQMRGRDALLVEGSDAENIVFLVADAQRRSTAKAVLHDFVQSVMSVAGLGQLPRAKANPPV